MNENVPAFVGVPEIKPLEVLSDKPSGREPLDMLHVMGVVPVAVKLAL